MSRAVDVERRARVAAVRAAVVAEMPDVRGGVVVRRAAAEAVLRVGRVLQRRASDARVVEPEHAAAGAGERADLRVVAVHDELRVGEGGDRLAPAGGDELELAVAVELVAEEVAEEQRLRPDPAGHLGQRALVDLEQPELGVARVQERGGDAGDEVGARVVVRDPDARPQDLGDHRRGRRLAVRRRDGDRALRQPRGERVDRAGSSFQSSFPGSVVPPPRPARRETSRPPDGGRFDGEGERRAHRLT